MFDCKTSGSNDSDIDNSLSVCFESTVFDSKSFGISISSVSFS